MAIDLRKRTAFFIRDLHAREWMRLGIYRQYPDRNMNAQELRSRKARHEAFLRDLLRKRGISPAWYAWYFYLLGHCFGLLSRFLPFSLLDAVESTLEWWLLMRYKDYFKKMQLDASLRSMIEAVQLRRMAHAEPGADALQLLERFITEQENLRQSAA